MCNVIKIEKGVTRHPSFRMKEPVDFCLCKGEQMAIVGPNGGGKSILVDIITGKYPLLQNEVVYDFSPSLSNLSSENLKYISFRDSYGDADNGYYYQQRWNSQDVENIPLVKDYLPQCKDESLKKTLYSIFNVNEMLEKPIVLLSSGELRKFQLTRTLFSEPRVLIMDNPFIGLDAGTRDLLKNLLNKLISVIGLQVILVLSKSDDIPDFITHVVVVKDMKCGRKMPIHEFRNIEIPAHVLSEEKEKSILELCYKEEQYTADNVVELKKVSIRYGDRTILKELDWIVKNEEKWALSGDNGAGKSTLLSLICADNPQSYACNITLFDKKRGSGESIWEIKKHIGYVSPEMHRAYLKNIPSIDIVASGLHDSIGLYKKPKEEERTKCIFWMNIFGIADLADRSFLQLSSGEQRLVLLVRAFVKDPELLILDEPLHGLDLYNRRLVKDIIETFCKRKNKTMIMVTHYKEELPDCITDSLYLVRNK